MVTQLTACSQILLVCQYFIGFSLIFKGNGNECVLIDKMYDFMYEIIIGIIVTMYVLI